VVHEAHFIHSFPTPLLLLPVTVAEVSRLSEKVKKHIFKVGHSFRNRCLSAAATAAFERKI